jgi:hypothetical protein
MNYKRDLLRHTVATLAYRAARAVENSTDEFGAYALAGRRPVEILAHMGDLFDWALTIAHGKPRWHNSTPLAWAEEQKRFFAALEAFDAYLASEEPIQGSIEGLFQGPVADALTHTGQLAMLRRLAGCPIRGENYYVARIPTGQVSAQLPSPVKPF